MTDEEARTTAIIGWTLAGLALLGWLIERSPAWWAWFKDFPLFERPRRWWAERPWASPIPRARVRRRRRGS